MSDTPVPVTIRVPSFLETEVGAREAVVEGRTVGEVLEAFSEQHPSARSFLFSITGRVRPYVVVHLDGEDVKHVDGIDTPVASGARIDLIAPSDGG